MKMQKSGVGPFFYIRGKIHSDQKAVDEAEKYGDFMTWGSHYEFWDVLCLAFPDFKTLEYNHFPRGRVTYNYKDNKFCIYVNPKLNNAEIINLIIEEYNLQNCEYIVDDTDEHYQY